MTYNDKRAGEHTESQEVRETERLRPAPLPHKVTLVHRALREQRSARVCCGWLLGNAGRDPQSSWSGICSGFPCQWKRGESVGTPSELQWNTIGRAKREVIGLSLN